MFNSSSTHFVTHLFRLFPNPSAGHFIIQLLFIVSGIRYRFKQIEVQSILWTKMLLFLSTLSLLLLVASLNKTLSVPLRSRKREAYNVYVGNWLSDDKLSCLLFGHHRKMFSIIMGLTRIGFFKSTRVCYGIDNESMTLSDARLITAVPDFESKAFDHHYLNHLCYRSYPNISVINRLSHLYYLKIIPAPFPATDSKLRAQMGERQHVVVDQ